VVLHFSLDLFPLGADLTLQPGKLNFESHLYLGDSQNRRLQLAAKVESIYGGTVKISVYARHWLVNKTGLPLVFRQEGASIDAPGQEEESEVARMAAPLMFTLSDTLSETSSSTLTMRVGSGLHTDSTPQWCRSFPLQPGSRVRKVSVSPKDSRRVNRIYIIGIDVRTGKGRYSDTLIVTFSPRFQIHNQSPYKMQISQHCFATTFHDMEAEASHLQAYPQSCLAFHWPRLDRDQLLCIRLLDLTTPGAATLWSGGIAIDCVDSFHMSIRDAGGRSTFVRVEVSIIAATYCIVLTDAANFPPPFRIDNFSEVPVTCHQSGVGDEALKTAVKAHQSIPYAWDEPTLPPHLTCSAPGGSSATYNMNVTGEGSQLTYENFISIVMTETFRVGASPSSVYGQHLVLDVEGTRIHLAPKEAGKRSQLWRMTSNGMLQHEGSCPPQDPSRGAASRDAQQELLKNSLVLDIAGPAVQPNSYVPLMLRKPDERRQLTQRWRFTEDGRLMCSHRGLYAQAKDGFCGIQKGNF
jgi:vacuolar protein sorting-associated protein 13D